MVSDYSNIFWPSLPLHVTLILGYINQLCIDEDWPVVHLTERQTNARNTSENYFLVEQSPVRQKFRPFPFQFFSALPKVSSKLRDEMDKRGKGQKSPGLWSLFNQRAHKRERGHPGGVHPDPVKKASLLTSFSGLFWLWVVLVLSAAFLVDVSRSQNDGDNDDSDEDEAPFVCPENRGNHADPKTCRRFYICSTDGAAHRSFCPNGLYWDDEKK